MRDLRIKETLITDVGILLLARHSLLQMVVFSDGLAEGRFSHAALAELQARLPDCEITLVGRGTFPDL